MMIYLLMLYKLAYSYLLMLYLYRFEVYCGKKEHNTDSNIADTKTGPAAVIRNLIAVFGSERREGMRLIMMDRYYTSVALAIQLLLLSFYSIGAIMANRIGFCADLVEKRKTGLANIDRGSCKVAKSKIVPTMSSIMWWDSKPVQLLSVGGNLNLDRAVRRERTGEQAEIP